MKWAIPVVVGVLWFPHSLERESHFYPTSDFGHYYLAAHGIYNEGTPDEFPYGQLWRWAMYPMRFVSHDAAFTVWYALLVMAWVALSRPLPWWLVIASCYPMMLNLELGQIAPILAFLCLSPWGSLLAANCKMYLVVFPLLHLWLRRDEGFPYPMPPP